MAKNPKQLASVDPVWDQIKYDARQAACSRAADRGIVHATTPGTIASIESAILPYRSQAAIPIENVDDWFGTPRSWIRPTSDEPGIGRRLRAPNLVAIYDRDPACPIGCCSRFSFLGYFRPFKPYRVSHYLGMRGQRDLGVFLPDAGVEIFGVDIHTGRTHG